MDEGPATAAAARRVGVAMSGGGHRATAWGFGTLLGVAAVHEAEHAQDGHAGIAVSSIASVSGGSIANGVVAATCPDLADLGPGELLLRIAPALRNVASDGLIFFAPGTNGYVAALLGAAAAAAVSSPLAVGGLVGAGRPWSVAAALLGPVVVVAAIGLLSSVRGLVAHRASKAALVALLVRVVAGAVVGLLVGVGAAMTRHAGALHRWPRPLVPLVVCAAAAVVAMGLASRRGEVVRTALDRVHFTNEGRSLLLRDLATRQVHHVFCATELQAGDQLYQSPRHASSYTFGVTLDPGTQTVARAVQASAALPMGFPPQVTDLAKAGMRFELQWEPVGRPAVPPTRMVLVDGGVYDNLSEQWYVGQAERIARWDGFASIEQPAELLVVASAGKALGWGAFTGRGWLGREVAGLARDQQVQYDQSTAPRRSALVQRFRAAENGLGGPIGVIVHIATSPRGMCDHIARGSEAEKASRAAAWLPVLDADRPASEWEAMARRNAAVPTVLRRLGRGPTADLVYHAAVLTRVALNVHYGLGVVGLPDRGAIGAAIGRQGPAPAGASAP